LKWEIEQQEKKGFTSRRAVDRIRKRKKGEGTFLKAKGFF